MKKVLKIIAAIVAIAGVAVAIYFAVKKLTGKKEVEYFDDDDFFECDNDIEIIEEKSAVEETPAEETPATEKKAAPKKTTKNAASTSTKEAKGETK